MARLRPAPTGRGGLCLSVGAGQAALGDPVPRNERAAAAGGPGDQAGLARHKQRHQRLHAAYTPPWAWRGAGVLRREASSPIPI